MHTVVLPLGFEGPFVFTCHHECKENTIHMINTVLILYSYIDAGNRTRDERSHTPRALGMAASSNCTTFSSSCSIL